MFLADGWIDYELLDTGEGEKLERWKDITLARPDPQIIWPKSEIALWKKVHGHYSRSEKGGGDWAFHQKLPERWTVSYKNLRFYVKPTGFKHTGLFPEQQINWNWMEAQIRKGIKRGMEKPKILNLFGYTGGATLACAAAGAQVTHVDAAKGMVQWAKENKELSKLPDTSFRWIVEDAMRFVQREIRRGNFYDGILMDPPSYGRGPNGEVWKLENELYSLVENASQLLSDKPLFFLINSYTTGFQASVLANILSLCIQRKRGGMVDAQELGIPITSSNTVLPCGNTGRWFPIEK